MSERSHILSSAERESGLSSFNRHISWNGLGVFLLNNTVVSLMAIHFGATNLELGYINAAFHVTGLVSMLVPRLFHGRRIVTVFGWAWMIRGFIAGLYGLLLVLSGPVARLTILVIFTLFCISRAMGVSVAHAVQREVMRDRDVGGSIVHLNVRLGYAQLTSQLLSFGLLSIGVLQGIRGLVLIAYIGAVMNTFASIHILRIPGRSRVESIPGENVMQTLWGAFHTRKQALPMLVHCFGMGTHVLFAFQVVFLRRVLELTDSIAVLFTLLGAVAAILSSILLKPFADSIGERPLLVITNGALVLFALIWALLPQTLPTPVYFLVGFGTYFFLRSLLTLKATALIKAIPDHNAVGYTAATNMLLGFIALALGLAGGALADIAPKSPSSALHQYSFTFFFTALIALVNMVLSMNLPRGRSLSLQETGRIMLSMRNLRAFMDGNQLDVVVDPAQRESLLLSLERSSAPVATSRLGERLRGPSVAEKERVLRILFRSPRNELRDAIIVEARDTGSYTRREAIFALGAYRDETTERVLREIAAAAGDDQTCEDTAVALKSLARHECVDLLPEIRRRLEQELSARAELDLSVGEALLDPQGEQLERLFERAFRRGSPGFAMTRILISLDRLDLHPGFQGYLRSERYVPGRGFTDLLEDASEFQSVQDHKQELLELVSRGDFGRFWTVIQEIIRQNVPEEHRPALARSVIGTEPPPGELSRIGALAALYVLHHSL